MAIDNLEQLRAWAGAKWYSKRPIALRLPELTEADAFAISERLNRQRSDCGCSLGAKGMVCAFVVTAAGLITHYGFFTTALLWRLPILLAATLFFAGLGKALGIAAARRRLQMEIDILFDCLTNQTQKE
ncbi:MAG: hypothetical protein EPO06_06845 [Burkholderiaceae bacterium]|nr:MAG: hypothetical protein EPO06_06845 [Burkholderiaceae bacterium]